MTKKRIILGVLENFGPHTGSFLSWPHPRSESLRFRSLDYWVDRARLLDEAGFDFQFFADGYGYPTDESGDVSEEAARFGMLFPAYAPDVLVSALAHATSRLGFVVTHITGRDHPIQLAKRFATLDHLTKGRIGWNVVTGSSQHVVASVFGDDEIWPHDERYRRAEEYLDLAVKFWEECWDDDAVVEDRQRRVFADRNRIHRVEHDGGYYRSSGYMAVDPSPQRTPLLFQAGTSRVGRTFAARNAESVFLQLNSIERMAEVVSDIRAQVANAGRDPRSIKLLVNLNVIVAATEAEARSQLESFEALQDDALIVASFRSLTGIDLDSLDWDRSLEEQLDLDGPIRQISQTNLDRYRATSDAAAPSVRAIIDQLRGSRGEGFIVGDPIIVADRLEELIDGADLDGILLRPVFDAATLRDFSSLVIPELRRRARVDSSGTGIDRTLRERFTGSSERTVPADRRRSLFDAAGLSPTTAGS